MSIILLGANGQLGSCIRSFAEQHAITLYSFSHQQIDLTDSLKIHQLFQKLEPKFLINAAAYTAVDLAETEKNLAMQLNADAVAMLAQYCADYDCVLIHPSTDYVFNGQTTDSYKEEDKTDPVNYYGVSKLRGEQLIVQICKKYIILRISWVFALQGKNFVRTILQLAKQKEQLSIIHDQIGCPTAAIHIAQVIFIIIDQLKMGSHHFGLYHYCDQPVTSWYDFALTIMSCAKKYSDFPLKELLPINSDQYKTAAQRPKNSVLNCTKIKTDFMVIPFDWRIALEDMIQQIYNSDNLS